MATASPVAAQGTEYPGCSETPETCTPLGVNEGVKTGNQTVTTILYAHWENRIWKSALTTQPPHPDYEDDLNAGYVIPTVYVDHEEAPCCKFDNSQFHMHFSPFAVKYTNQGLQVGLDQSFHGPTEVVDDVVGYVYLSAQSTPDTVPRPPGGPGVMPSLGVYMRLETGRHPWSGALIAEGDMGIGYESPNPGRWSEGTTMINRPGEDTVYEFAIRMPLTRSPWAFSTGDPGFVFTAVPYQVDVDGVAEFTSADWRIRTGPEFPHRLHLQTTPPLVDSGLDLRGDFPAGHLYMTWSVWSAWGAYDPDPATFEFRLMGPDGGDVAVEPPRLQYPYNAHGLFEPINVTWKTSVPAEDLRDGTYHLSASVMNLQGTYMLQRNATIVVQDGEAWLDGDVTALEGDTAAGIGAAAVVAAALIGALLRCRPRRRSGKP